MDEWYIVAKRSLCASCDGLGFIPFRCEKCDGKGNLPGWLKNWTCECEGKTRKNCPKCTSPQGSPKISKNIRRT
jgi:hypothetical protein